MIDSSAGFDFSYLESMAVGDPDIRAELIVILDGQLQEDHAALRKAFEAAETTEIFEASHRMKSTLAYTGNQEAMAWNREIEEKARLNIDVASLLEVWQLLHNRLYEMELALRSMH